MKSILRALALTGIVAFGAAAGAQAQTRVFIGVRAPVVEAIPPCPGAGYQWTPGYYSGSVFVSGRWINRGFDRDRVVERNYYRDAHRGLRYDRNDRSHR
jgi:hypothetical protein